MAFGSKENKTPVQVPAHIGIIMDVYRCKISHALRVFHGKLEPPR